MSRVQTLKKLQGMLEGFLDKATAIKEKRLTVLGGMNQLDDLTRASEEGQDVTDRVAEWFSDRKVWPESGLLKPVDCKRIEQMLGQICKNLHGNSPQTPATEKVESVIAEWLESGLADGKSITLARGSEIAEEVDNITRVRNQMQTILDRFNDLAEGKDHVLSALDSALNRAVEHHDRDALLLSAFLIYYLRLDKYMVEPYVKRLKKAEKLFSKEDYDA